MGTNHCQSTTRNNEGFLMTKIYQASFDTRNYEFKAFGETPDEAIATLKSAFTTFMVRNGGTYTWEEMLDDLFIEELKTGTSQIR